MVAWPRVDGHRRAEASRIPKLRRELTTKVRGAILPRRPLGLPAWVFPKPSTSARRDVERHGCGRERHSRASRNVVERGNRPGAQRAEHARHAGGAAAELLDAPRVLVKQCEQPVRGVYGAACGLRDAFEKEIEPRLPVALETNGVQTLTILCSMLFEIQAQIQQRLRQDAGIVQHHGNEQPLHAAVAVEKRMNAFEPHMGKASLDERRQRLSFVVAEDLRRDAARRAPALPRSWTLPPQSPRTAPPAHRRTSSARSRPSFFTTEQPMQRSRIRA